MSNPYIYIVKNKQNGKFYIGSQCSGKIIGINYFTSSTNKEFKEDFKNNTNNYDIWKIASFDNYEECIREENKLIKENFENSLILNKGYILGEHPLTRTKYNTESERKQARKNSVNKYNRNNKEKSKQYRETHKEELKVKNKQYNEINKKEISLRVKIVNMIKKDKESYDKYSKLPFSEKKKFREEYYIKVKSKG